MTDETVLVAGGGIAGLALALTLHQIGVKVRVFEAAPDMRPMGVGINLQPNAVRELADLGIGEDILDDVGVPIDEWALVAANGQDIHAEPRGRDAGYTWPQIAVHRGAFHMLLYRIVCERLGPGVVQPGCRVTGYEMTKAGVTAQIDHADGSSSTAQGAVLIGADGIHSRIRAKMHPDQPPIHWGGKILWRGTVQARPLRGGRSFIGLGDRYDRVVIYPISHPLADGTVTLNWIAERTVESQGVWPGDAWFRAVEVEDFISHFEGFRYDWLDVPALLRQADMAFENPMIDRDPVPTWVDGRVALMGDAAHAMYPTGSNGAGQAIIDARVLGAKFVAHGVTAEALAAYNAELCGPVSALVLRNRGEGPFGLLNLLAERGWDGAGDIDAAVSPEDRAAYLSGYRQQAGFDIAELNARAPIIAPEDRIA